MSDRIRSSYLPNEVIKFLNKSNFTDETNYSPTNDLAFFYKPDKWIKDNIKLTHDWEVSYEWGINQRITEKIGRAHV